MSVYSNVQPEDLQHSGPHVWPRISAEEPVDRFIHARPELAFLQAIRRQKDTREEMDRDPPNAIGIRIVRLYTYIEEGKTRQKYEHMVRFVQPIETDDTSALVRRFLENLRRCAKRSFPNQPLINVWIQLRFYDPQIKRNQGKLLNFQQRWL